MQQAIEAIQQILALDEVGLDSLAEMSAKKAAPSPLILGLVNGGVPSAGEGDLAGVLNPQLPQAAPQQPQTAPPAQTQGGISPVQNPREPAKLTTFLGG